MEEKANRKEATHGVTKETQQWLFLSGLIWCVWMQVFYLSAYPLQSVTLFGILPLSVEPLWFGLCRTILLLIQRMTYTWSHFSYPLVEAAVVILDKIPRLYAIYWSKWMQCLCFVQQSNSIQVFVWESFYCCVCVTDGLTLSVIWLKERERETRSTLDKCSIYVFYGVSICLSSLMSSDLWVI